MINDGDSISLFGRASEIGGLSSTRRVSPEIAYGSPPNPNTEPTLDITPARAGASTPSSECNFGSIYQDGGTWYIRGGPLIAGPDTYTVADESFSVAAPLTTFYWLVVDVVANNDPVADRLFSGIESSTAPVWTSGASYGSPTIPTGAVPAGTAIIPIGKLVVAGGVPSFLTAGLCDTLTVHHCPGSLTVA